MAINDDLNKRPQPTIPDDPSDPPRFAQPTETTKDAFVAELKKFFNRNDTIYNSTLKQAPTIRKFDFSFKKTETSHETAVKIIRKLPNLNENLPLVAVLAATGRNISMGIGGQLVTRVSAITNVLSGNAQPYNLPPSSTLVFRTTSKTKEVFTTTIIFRTSRFTNIAQATAQEVCDEINFQSLYAHASVGQGNKINLGYGGPLTQGVTGDIEIGDGAGNAGTASSILGFTNGQKAEYTSTTAFNRYLQSTALDIAIEVVAEDDNVRTELHDLVWSFFTFFMDSRDYTLLGRSSFDPSIPNETYQVIIKPDLSMAGENEVPRPGDEVDKLYVNRMNVPVTTIQYIDRAVVSGGITPLYLDANNVQQDGTIPQKN